MEAQINATHHRYGSIEVDAALLLFILLFITVTESITQKYYEAAYYSYI